MLYKSQPQGPLRVARTPLTRGLAIACIPGWPEFFSKALPVRSGTSIPIVNAWGRGVSTPSTQVAGAYTYTVNLPAAFDCTLLVLHRCITNNTPSVFALELNSAEPVSLGATGSLMRFRTASNSTSDIGLTTGAHNCIVGVKRVNSNELYLNGVQQTTAVTGNRTIDAITELSVGRNAGGNNLENVEYSLILYWQRALTLSAIAEVSAMPYQVFERRPLRFAASAGVASGLKALGSAASSGGGIGVSAAGAAG